MTKGTMVVRETGQRGATSRLSIFVLVGLVLVVACVSVYFLLKSGDKESPREVRVYPQQEVVIKYCEGILMGSAEEALSSTTADWPEKDAFIAAVQKQSEKIESLEFTIGPVEVLEWETIDEAQRVAVSKPLEIVRDRSTGEIRTRPIRGKDIEWMLEKQITADGPRWFLVAERRRWSILASGWLHQPRKKVPDSATIVMKKDIIKKEIIVQILSDNTVVSEKTVSY